MKLLVERIAADGVVFSFEGGVEGSEFYFEGAGGVMGHWGFLLGGAKGENGDWKKEEERCAEFFVHDGLGRFGIGRGNIA